MKKILSILTLMLLSLTLVSCKNEEIPLVPLEPSTPIVTENGKISDFISNINYQSLVESNTEMNLSIYIPSVKVTDGPMPLIINDISVDINLMSNFSTYEDSEALLELSVNIKNIKMDFGFMTSDFLNNINIFQGFYLDEGNLYSTFYSYLKDAGEGSKDLSEIIGFIELVVIGELPEDIKHIVANNLFLIENYKEVRENAFTEELFEDFKSTFNELEEMLKVIINEDLLNDSLVNLNLENNILYVTEKEDNTLPFTKFNLQVVEENNNLSKLNGNVTLPLDELTNVQISFSLKTNGEFSVRLPQNLSDYKVVDQLRIEKTIDYVIKSLNGEIIPIVPIGPAIEEELE